MGLLVRYFLPISFAVFLDCSINVSQISKYSQLQCQSQKNNFNLNFHFFLNCEITKGCGALGDLTEYFFNYQIKNKT